MEQHKHGETTNHGQSKIEQNKHRTTHIEKSNLETRIWKTNMDNNTWKTNMEKQKWKKQNIDNTKLDKPNLKHNWKKH